MSKNKEQKKVSFVTGNYLKIIVDRDDNQLIFTNNEGKPLITSLDHVKPMDDYVGWEPLQDGTYRVICKGLQQDITLTYDMSNFIQPNFDVDLNLSFWIIPTNATTFYLVQGDTTLPLNIVKIGNTSTGGGGGKNIVGGDNILVDDSTPNTAIINLSPDLSNIYSISGSGDQALTLEAGNISLETSILDTQNKIELGSSGITLQSIDGDNSASVQVSPSGVMINDNVITFSTQATEGNPIITNTDLQNAISNIPTPSSITDYDQLTNKPWTHESDPFASWISVQEGIGEVDCTNVPVSVKGLYVSSESGGTDAGIHLDPNSTNWHIVYKESDGKVHIRGMAQEWDDGSPLIADGASALSADSYLLNVRKDASGNIERNWLKVSDVETGNDVLITTLSFTNPTVGVSQTFNFSDVSAIHGIIETGAVLYATNGIGLVVSVDNTNSTLVASFIAAYTTSIPNTLAVASSINATFNSTTGLLDIKITDYAGQVHDTQAAINIGEYEHTFTFESNDNKNYKIDASTIQYFESNSSLFNNNATFITYMNSHGISTITGLSGSVTNLYPDEIDIDLSSIELGDTIMEITFASDIQISPDSVTWFQLESKTTFSIGPGELSGEYVIRIKPSDLDAITIYNSASGFASDVSIPGIFDWKQNTRKLTFNELNTKVVDASNLPFVYNGKIQVGTVNEAWIDGGIPVSLTYLSSQGSYMWEVIDVESNTHEIPFIGELTIARDNVGSQPVPSTNNYDALINKPFSMIHQNLEKYIDNIKKTSASAKKLATSAQTLASTNAAAIAGLELVVNTPTPIPIWWPHLGLRFLIPTLEAEIAQNAANYLAAVHRMDGLESRIYDLEDTIAHSQITVNVGLDSTLYGISITDTTAPQSKHHYILGVKNAGTGMNGGPEYALTANPNFNGVDEGRFLKFNRFNALKNTILTLQFDTNQFTVDTADRFALSNNIIWENNVLLEDFATANVRNWLFMQDTGVGIRRTAGLKTTQLTLTDDRFTISLDTDREQYIFTENGLGMVGKGIHDLADPISDQDAATKKYVDSHSGGTDNYNELNNKPIIQQEQNAVWLVPGTDTPIIMSTNSYTRIKNKNDNTNAINIAQTANSLGNPKGTAMFIADSDYATVISPGEGHSRIKVSEYGVLIESESAGRAGFLFADTLDMQNNRIENLPDPSDDSEPATKGYVDAQVAGGGGDYDALQHIPIVQSNPTVTVQWLTPGGITLIAAGKADDPIASNRNLHILNIANNVPAISLTNDSNIMASPGGGNCLTITNDTVVLSQPNSAARFIRITGAGIHLTTAGTTYLFNASGINAGSKKITNMLDPTNNQDGATKKYVDNAIANQAFSPAGGGSWSYNGTTAMNMSQQKITNSPDPTADSDLSTKKYVDDAVSRAVSVVRHTLFLSIATLYTGSVNIFTNNQSAFTTATLSTYLQQRGFIDRARLYPATGYGVVNSLYCPVMGICYNGAGKVAVFVVNPSMGPVSLDTTVTRDTMG